MAPIMAFRACFIRGMGALGSGRLHIGDIVFIAIRDLLCKLGKHEHKSNFFQGVREWAVISAQLRIEQRQILTRPEN